MPARIPLSHVKALGFDFAAAVAEYRQALADWAARPADWDPVPAPMPMHPLVGVAVTVGSYELVDDAPPPEAGPSLEEKQKKLAEGVRIALAAAQHVVVPALKRPLLELQTKRAVETRWENRTLGDRELLNMRKAIEERFAANELHAAHQIAAIADLTDATVDGWKMEPFPEGAIAPAPLSIEDKRAQLANEVDVEINRRLALVQHPFKRELLNLRVANAAVKPEGERSADDLAALKECADVTAKEGLLRMHAAKLKAAIAELDEAGLAAWKPEPFPGS